MGGHGQPPTDHCLLHLFEIFKTHVPQAAITSLWEVLDDLGLPEGRPAAVPRTVAVHDACSTRHEKQIHESVRNILGRAGMAIEELPLSGEHTECCGYGGLMFFANPELAKRVIDRRIHESPADYVAYCAMCRDYWPTGASAPSTFWTWCWALHGTRPPVAGRRAIPSAMKTGST